MLSHASKYSELTDAQFSALGRVLIESSNIEHLLERIIIRLLRAPDYPALAVTSQLGYYQRLKALNILIDTHRRRYHSKLINKTTLDKLSDLIKQVDQFRIDRNRCAHYLWCRDTDEKVFGIKFTGKHGDSQKPNQDCVTFTVMELNSIATQMHAIVDGLITILESLPEREEV
jgi:hypothetical protein